MGRLGLPPDPIFMYAGSPNTWLYFYNLVPLGGWIPDSGRWLQGQAAIDRSQAIRATGFNPRAYVWDGNTMQWSKMYFEIAPGLPQPP